MEKTRLIHESRVEILVDSEERPDGDYVLYVMQAAHRTEQNHALEWAARKANELEKPLLVGFGLDSQFPEANLRHFTFMLEGLEKTAEALRRRNIGFVIRKGSPAEVASNLAERAAHVVIDRGYLRYHKDLYRDLTAALDVRCTQIETETPVPHHLISQKKEYAARTIRPRVMKPLDDHLVWLETTPLEVDASSLQVKGEEFSGLIDSLKLENLSAVSSHFEGGTAQAKSRFRKFLTQELSDYDELRNQPHTPRVSHMSPYLHYGQISALHLVLMLKEHIGRSSKNSESYVEEIVVRRALGQNFTLHEPDYDKFSCLPEWAKDSLEKHKEDPREHVYTRAQLEEAKTHDPYWNAAQNEMRRTGYMHNHMRMYWGKQILAWCNTPEYAYQTTLYLNNKYFLDGRDSNSYSNVAWLFGLHDQGWKERAVYGKVRCMTQGGLERKCDPKAYVRWVDSLV